ncbi:hypothetical protein HZA98_00825 [Candidatus Woesearchaeota archaeon]|nr:hypothetical protein [Candidatus Woesearchaeota archaeon]
MAEELIVKKWGNSLAVIIPNEVIVQRHIKANQKILIDFGTKVDLGSIFGTFKTKKTAQELKDFAREGWF